MSFKPAKSRTLVLKKRRVLDKFCFSISRSQIPTILKQPMKSLGKTFNNSHRDTLEVKNCCEELEGWLKGKDKTGLPGKFKASM